MFNNLAGAVFDVQNDESFRDDLGSPASVFNNIGTLQKTAGDGTTLISVAVINTGTILNTSGGTLDIPNCTGTGTGCP